MSDPKILLIDDDPKASSMLRDVEVKSLQPTDDSFGSEVEAIISDVDLILLDHNLHLQQNLSLSAIDGASFVGNLRSWARTKNVALPPIAIFTSDDEAFAHERPSVGAAGRLGGSFVNRESRIAPTLDVEWLLMKDEAGAQSALSLARASAQLASISKDGRVSLGETIELLEIPNEPDWSKIAAASVPHSRPPINEPGAATAGPRGVTGVLRWLLHHVLPYPGLLISNEYAAWSLGISEADFQLAVEGKLGRFSELLNQATYTGLGHNLFPRRWWTAGIDWINWQIREISYSKESLQEAYDEISGSKLELVSPSEHVVVLDSDLENPGIAKLEEAIEIHPPGWPVDGLQAWILRDEARNDDVARSMIDPEELASLK